MHVPINQDEIRHGDLVTYRHSEAGGGICTKEAIDSDSGLLVERPYNCAKYFNVADLEIISVESEGDQSSYTWSKPLDDAFEDLEYIKNEEKKE